MSRALTAAAEQIAEVLEAQRRVHAVAVVLTLDGCPEGLERLDEGRCVRVVGGVGEGAAREVCRRKGNQEDVSSDTVCVEVWETSCQPS